LTDSGKGDTLDAREPGPEDYPGLQRGVMMERPLVTIELPASLYAELQSLAADEQTDLVELIRHLVDMASQRRGWLRDLALLREQVRQVGGLQVSATREEVVKRLRQTRREIFEAEYAHLYR
jgi:hypothetical protein